MPDPGFPARLDILRAVFDAGDREGKLVIARQVNHICRQMHDDAVSAIPLLRHMLEAGDAGISKEALLGIGECGATGASVLVELAQSEDPALRAGAAFALGQVYSVAPPVTDTLVRLVRSRCDSDRAAALQALGALGVNRDVASSLAPHEALIVAAFDDTADEAARWAIYAFDGLCLDDSRHIDFILERLARRPTRHSEALAESLRSRLERTDAGPWLPRLVELARRDTSLAITLIEIFADQYAAARAAIPALEPLLDRNDFVSIRAGLALWRIDGRTDVLPVLAALVGDAPDEVSEVVGLMGPAAAPLLRPLVKAINLYWKDSDWDAMCALTRALAALQSTDPVAIETLSYALDHESPDVKLWAIRGLRAAGPAARSALIELREYADAEAHPDFIVEAARTAIRAIERSP